MGNAMLCDSAGCLNAPLASESGEERVAAKLEGGVAVHVLRRHPGLLSEDGEEIGVERAKALLQEVGADGASCDDLAAGDTIPLGVFVSLLECSCPDLDEALFVSAAEKSALQSSGPGMVAAVRVRNLSGEELVVVERRHCPQMTVGALRAKVLAAVGREECDVSLLLGERMLEDGEMLEHLSAAGEVLEVGAVLQELPQFDPNLRTEDHLDVVKRALLCSSAAKHLEGAKRLRLMLCGRQGIEALSDLVVQLGVLGRLVEFSGDASQPTLQYEAMWVLTNVASGNSAQSRAVIDAGALPVLVAGVAEGNADVQDEAVWALGNLAGDCAEHRDMALDAGALQRIVDAVGRSREADLALRRHAAWAISNLCRFKPRPPVERTSPAIPTLASLLRCDDVELLADTCQAFLYIADPDDGIQAVVDSGVTPRLVELLWHKDAAVQRPALLALGSICSAESPVPTQAVLDASALPAVLGLLQHESARIRQEACYLLSNVAGGTKEQCGRVVGLTGMLEAMVTAARDDSRDVRKEATWVLANIVSHGEAEFVREAVRAGALGAFKEAVEENGPSRAPAITGLLDVLRAGEGAPGDNLYASKIVRMHGRDWLGAAGRDGELGEILKILSSVKSPEAGE